MKKLSDTEAESEKSVAYKKACVFANCNYVFRNLSNT